VLHEVDGADGAATPFALRLRTLRERAGLTQEELAGRAGLTSHAVSALERGTRTRPYPHTVRALAGALGMSDAEQTDLIASIPSRRSPAAGPAKAEQPAVSPPAGLVVPPTQLYGRDGDVLALTSLVRSGHVRLVTLTGMGGVGKTRLAVALATELAGDFPDGVVQVTLASVASAAAVLDHLGRALGLAGADGPDAVELVAAHLGSRRMLLVLDNFEHLLDAAADVGRLVATCPTLTVLVSSRAPLRVRGEHEYPVGPLALPLSSAASVEELTGSPSGALVLDRAQAVSPRLDLTPDSVRALATLCARLAGIPLALELAAARLRLLTPSALLERLDSVLDSAASARDLPPRQRTMRATLDWSYGLLSAEEQLLFTVLAVFRGGATLDAVEEVAAQGAEIREADVLDLLELLAEQSMVVVRTGVDGRHRYGMLEPVAQYAESLLVGEVADRSERAHAAYYLRQAERAAVGLERSDQVEWVARTEADEANLLVAVDRALAHGYPEVGAGIVWSLWLYWWLRGQTTVGRQYAEGCLRASLPPGLQARVHMTVACMAYAGGDPVAAGGHWGAALMMHELLHDAEVACKASAGTGLAALASNDLDGAARAFRSSLPYCTEAGEAGVWMASLVHVWLGTVVLLQGDAAGAVSEIRRGLQIARGRGDRLSTYVALYNLSQVAIASGDHAAARGYLDEGITLSEQTQDLANLAYFLDALAVVESAAGSPDRVPVLLGAARSFRDTVGANVYAYYVPDDALREAAEQAARESLGDEAYQGWVEVGRAFDLTAAVRFALAPGSAA
jgi:predicted ATPase/transcriptional regulator with XRE-family HTH domain